MSMTEEKKIRILIADDHVMLQEGLRTLLEMEPDMAIIAEAANGRDAVTKALTLIPDILIMDIRMPECDGIDATRQILSQSSEIKILCLTMHQEESTVLAMLEAGAKGYLLKTSAVEELVKAVRVVYSGETYLSPPIASIVLENRIIKRPAENQTGHYEELTLREREVLHLIAEGHHSKSIADLLSISPKTVLVHRQNLMKKLCIRSISDLIRYALRHGITNL
jgi:DNA-binding NarL/FixJ family response regulator